MKPITIKLIEKLSMSFVIVKKICQKCKEARITFILLLSLIGWISNSAISQAALSVSTVNFIIGNSPKFNTELEQEITKNRFSLLRFNYQGNTYNNDNLQTMPPVDPLQTIQSFLQQVALSPVILSEEDTIDIDGDGDMTATFITTTVTVLDKNNQALDPTYNFCDNVDKAPMSLQLNAKLNLSSRYGVPNTTTYNVSQQYTLAFKPTICYLKPSLIYGGGKYAGDASVWNPKNGFIYNPDKVNFPTTGMDGLSYDVKVLGVNVLEEEIHRIYSTTTNVNLTFNPVDSQTLNIKMNGPVADNPRKFTPNTFNIHLGPLIRYSFNINNWFIHNNDQSLTWANANSWCNQLGGNQGYQLPAITQLSNGSTDTGASQTYTRAIGQGLLAEWGSLVSYGLMTYGYIWSGTPRTSGGYFDAYNVNGYISAPLLTLEEKSLCVSK